VFALRERRRGAAGPVDVAFTDRHGGVSRPPFDSLDLRGKDRARQAEFDANAAIVADAFEVGGLVTMRQVHGKDVTVVGPVPHSGLEADAMVTMSPDVTLTVRVADCVPVVLADADQGVLGVAHAGRQGVALGVISAAVASMRELGAQDIHAWIGPHICGGCYEVPAEMRAEVTQVVPAAFATTTWGTASLDLGAAVRAQLEQAACTFTAVGTCTRESPDLYSYRRDGEQAGRFAGLIVLRVADRV